MSLRPEASRPDVRSLLAGALDLGDVADLARDRLPSAVWDFVTGGADDEHTVAANRAALDRIGIVSRVLQDVSVVDTSTTLFERWVPAPVAVAPVAYHRLAHDDGELATARATHARGIPLCLSTLSSCSIEAVAAEAGPLWFQLYWLRDRRLRTDLVRRAEAAGCEALVLTVDVPWMGRRLRDIRNGFVLSDDIHAANLPSGVARTERDADGSTVAAHTEAILSPALTWAEVAELRAATRMPLILKGILSADDARTAVEVGADGIVVSNHGGRQLDGAAASIECLADVRAAVGEACAVLLDGGVRSGVDVLRAVALGADAVLVGRPVMHGLAVGGQAGVAHVMDLLIDGLRNALGLAGCADLAQARELRVVPLAR